MEAADLAVILFGGIAGATVFGFVRPDRESHVRAAGTAGIGVLTSLFITPGICRYCDFDAIEYKAATAFAIGLIGMTICKIIVIAVQTEAGDAASWLKKAVKKFFGVTE